MMNLIHRRTVWIGAAVVLVMLVGALVVFRARLLPGERKAEIAGVAQTEVDKSENDSDPSPAPEVLRIDPQGNTGGGGGEDVAYYTCSMHPSVKHNEQGTCPICSMNLTPVTRQEVETGVILVDAVRRQLLGVRTEAVARKPMTLRLRMVGRVDYDETRLTDITLRVEGWIEKLHVEVTGQRVKEGDKLFALYSPSLYAAQEEYVQALGTGSTAAGRGSRETLIRAARERLELWGLAEEQIEKLESDHAARQTVDIVSPASGYVIEKTVVEGDHVSPGQHLYRIAALDRVWITADVYEADLPLIDIGQDAEVTLPYLPGKRYGGRVAYVYPYLDRSSRTGRIRIELANRGFELRPDMFANVELEVGLGRRLQVPREAVLYTGKRRLVFVDLGEGRLQPKEIELGVKGDGVYEVLSGLREGDLVVTSGNFLVAAESRIRSAARFWGGDDEDQ